jgi:hypothetical protein
VNPAARVRVGDEYGSLVRGSERVVVVAEVDVDLVVMAGIEVDMVVAGKAGLRVRRIHGLVFVATVGVVW